MKPIAMVIAVAVTSVWAIGTANTAEAVIAIIRQTGMFSLASGQATTAHVVNTGEERGIIINWRVLDSVGNVLAQSNRRRLEFGEATSFSFAGLALSEGQRTTIRVELTVEGAARNHPGFIATQEVHNVSDGKTTVFLPYIEQ